MQLYSKVLILKTGQLAVRYLEMKIKLSRTFGFITIFFAIFSPDVSGIKKVPTTPDPSW